MNVPREYIFKFMVDRVSELIKSGSGVLDAIRSVSRETGMTVDALRCAYYRANIDRDRTHGNRLLTKRQEEVLLHLAVSFSVANKGWNMKIFKSVMKNLFDIQPERHWYKKWMTENKKYLSKRKSKFLAKKRTSSDMLAEVSSFIGQVEAVLAHTGMTADNVVNYDEARVCIDTNGELVMEFRWKERANASGNYAQVLG